MYKYSNETRKTRNYVSSNLIAKYEYNRGAGGTNLALRLKLSASSPIRA